MAPTFLEKSKLSRIQAKWRSLQQSGRKAVIPYVVAGDPSPEVTVSLMHDLVAAGADMLELGVPFSDPMAEGPVIQKGHERALAHRVSLRGSLSAIREFRQIDASTPVILMGYANPIERMGYTVFAEEAAKAGVDGLITVDLPPEEVETMNAELKKVGIDNIFLISPTTPSERIPLITAQASGFIYYVSLKGVTGAANINTQEVAAKVEQIKSETDLPVAVGFGIKDAVSAAAVASVADGVVVGSALVSLLGNEDKTIESRCKDAVALLSEIRSGV
jgi:tryptophan synthase alpha chain